MAIDYPRFLRDALRGVLRRVLDRLAEIGPTGEAHLLLTFRTDQEDIVLPADLRSRFPNVMTIELQHQFWELATDDLGFSVMLAFGGKRSYLFVPWEAVVGFVDPETSFGLSFEVSEEEEVPEAEEEPSSVEIPAGDADVIPFDRFRRRDE